MAETRIGLDQISSINNNQNLGAYLTNLDNNVGFFAGQVANTSALSALTPETDMHVFVKSDNKWVRYNGSSWVDITASGSGGGGSTNLDGLTDVILSNPSNGQALVYNGSTWVNGNVSGGNGATNLDGLTDVVITSASSGQVIKYNGTNWINTGISIADVTNLQASLDAKVTSSSPSFVGTPTAPTASTNTNTTQIATTQFVVNALGSTSSVVVDGGSF